MPATPAAESVTLAHFKPLAGDNMGQSFPVHFNPASLNYSIANTQGGQGQNGTNVQFVSQSTATLTMDLVFDTTLTGEDVREATDKMAQLLRPYQEGDGKVPPNVEFSWGTYSFTGIVTQYRETLDFFSAGGVPLRSAINITLSSNGVEFESRKNPNASVDGAGGTEPFVLSASLGASAVANALGDPRAARAIASASGSASLRFSLGASLAVTGSASLSAPSAFAAGGVGVGISAGVGIGLGAGAGLGISATAGASFAGLRASGGGASNAGIANARALMPPASATSANGGFALGGAARNTAGGSLNANVGAGATLSTGIGFPE